MDNNAKLRPLYLAKILYERTDEDHYLTTMQLAQILEEEYGIPAHRQTIKTDIELDYTLDDFKLSHYDEGKLRAWCKKLDIKEASVFGAEGK